jgi:hypothetical protein
LERHNFIDMPAVLHIRKVYPSTNEYVNLCEKPAAIGEWFCERFVEPEGNVIVACAVSGGEVRGCLESGRHVVAVDNDPRQMEFIWAYFGALDAELLAVQQKKLGIKATQGEENKTTSGDVAGTATLDPPISFCPQCGCHTVSGRHLFQCECDRLFCEACGYPQMSEESDTLPTQCRRDCKATPPWKKLPLSEKTEATEPE